LQRRTDGRTTARCDERWEWEWAKNFGLASSEKQQTAVPQMSVFQGAA
jgi:hypothetical protein